MASFKYSSEKPNNQNNNQNKVGYFNLKKDGEEAIVKFLYTSPEEFDLFTVHTIQLDNRYKKIDCIRTPYDHIDKCPLCKSGNKSQRKFFIKLLQYVKDETTGELKAVPKIWERSDKYADTINNLINEYGDLQNSVFKVRRNGAEGSMKTTYDIMYASPIVYKPEIYTNNPDAFKDFDFFQSNFITTKSVDELAAIVDNSNKVNEPKPITNTTNIDCTQTPTTPTDDPDNRPKRVYTY